MNLDYILIGLCNPGEKYINTRHNVGKISIEYLANKYKIKMKFCKKINAYYGYGNLFDFKIGLLIPNTYMNNSGESIYKFKKVYDNIDDNKIIIIHDDISIKLGNIKYKLTGSHGGHNGVKSILEILQTKNIARIKVGIGIYDNKINPILSDWIISEFNINELIEIKKCISNNFIKLLLLNLK